MRALAVVYACSGCSSAGAFADHVARSLDREGMARYGVAKRNGANFSADDADRVLHAIRADLE
jgi:uncharacterized metal-binding protein